MKKIRLLTISATSERGGSDINLLRLLKNLDHSEYEIMHLMPYAGPLLEEFRSAGVRVEITDMPRVRVFKNPVRYIVVLFKFLPTVIRIKRIIEDSKIDIVCTSSMVNLYGALAARLACRPHILMALEYLTILKPIGSYFYFLSEKIVCCSHRVSKMFKKSDKVIVVYPGIDLEEFNPGIDSRALREGLGINYKLVSMFTRLANWKGVEVFIRAAACIETGAKFIIFAELVKGREAYASKLNELIKQLGLKDKVIIRSIGYKNIPMAIAASDIVVHASLRPEPFGLVIIEAMATGKPIIASRLGGPLEIISDGSDGVLIEPGDPKILARAISGLLENPGLARQMGLRAREKAVKAFDLKGYAQNFSVIFKDALNKGGNSKLAPVNKDAVKKVLVMQLFGMGDLICSLPLLEALKEYFSKSHITLLIDAKLNELANLIEPKVEIIGYKKGLLGKVRLLGRVRRGGFDMAVILNPLFAGTWIAYLSGAKYRIGYIRDYERIQNIEKISRLLTHPVFPLDRPMHDVERYLGIAGFLGIDTAHSAPKLKIPGRAEGWADEFLQDSGIRQNDFILGINPHAAWQSRCWSMEKFAQVADIMVDRHNAKVIFFGSSAIIDMHRINMIELSIQRKAAYAAGMTDMPKLAALLNKCSIFLTNDSGPMHLAWALGVNMVALFGPGDIDKFGHKRGNIINIAAQGITCSPCILNYRYRDNCADNLCMRNIEVNEVIKAIEMLSVVKNG